METAKKILLLLIVGSIALTPLLPHGIKVKFPDPALYGGTLRDWFAQATPWDSQVLLVAAVVLLFTYGLMKWSSGGLPKLRKGEAGDPSK